MEGMKTVRKAGIRQKRKIHRQKAIERDGSKDDSKESCWRGRCDGVVVRWREMVAGKLG